MFYHLTYGDEVDLSSARDAAERWALEVQMGEFGQTPRRLLAEPHRHCLPAQARPPSPVLLTVSALAVRTRPLGTGQGDWAADEPAHPLASAVATLSWARGRPCC